MTRDGVLKRYDMSGGATSQFFRELVAGFGKDGFVKHLADKMTDNSEMSLIL